MTEHVLIVGAGSAGSVLAERLSADPDRRVTVVESGPGPDVPGVRELIDDAMSLPIDPDSPVVRRYRTLLTGRPPRETDIVRGACLGGSGAVNGCYFWRALPQDFETVPGWSWSEVETHYQAVESRIPVHPVSELSNGTQRFVAAADRAGYRKDIAAVPLNIAGGRRIGPGAAFLESAINRANLTVLTGTRVERVRISAGRAVGVDVVGPDGAGELEADRVVLAAGAVGTAQLLMLSGIGPAAELRDLGIDTRVDLPVGQHCWDHPEWMVRTDWAAADGLPVLEVVLHHGDIEIRPYTTGFGSDSAGIGVALMRPKARGRVSLISADPSAPVRIEHCYDSEAADIAALRRGCDIVAEILGDAMTPDEPLWSTSQHLSGTAPIGSVLDEQCRVHGLDGLWVVDGSVLPAPLRRGPHATIAMIGHRAADFF